MPISKFGGAYRVEVGVPGQELELLHFLMGLHQEIGRYPVDSRKATNAIANTIRDGAVFNVRLDDGSDELVGSVALVIASHWYADAQYFTDRWFYVTPDHRDGGAVMRMLLAEVGALSDETGLEALLVPHNPRARPRSRQTPFERRASVLRFQPTGQTVSIAPRRHG